MDFNPNVRDMLTGKTPTQKANIVSLPSFLNDLQKNQPSQPKAQPQKIGLGQTLAQSKLSRMVQAPLAKTADLAFKGISTGISNLMYRAPLSGRADAETKLNLEDRKSAFKNGAVGTLGYELSLGNRNIIKNPSQFADTLSMGVAKKPLQTAVKKLASNIRLDKFDVPKESIENLSRIIQENNNFGLQRRGVQTFKDSEKLAQELLPKLKLKTGTALNAEELQSLGNTVAGLQNKIGSVSKKIAEGNNGDLALLELSKAKEELTYALSSLSGATAEAGRSLSILRNLRKATESGDVKLIRDAVKLSGGRETAETISRKLVELGDDNLAKIRFIRDISKVKTTDKINEVWINSILSNPLTQAVNITGNTLQALLKIPTRAVQATIQKPGSRKVFYGEIPHQVIGAVEGLQDGVRKALYVMRNGISPENASKLDIQYLPSIKGKTGEIIRLPTKALGAMDEFFKAVVGTSEMRSLAYRQARNEGLKGQSAVKRMHELVENPTKELYEAVDLAKLETTFQQPLGKMGAAVMNARESVPGLRYIIPFIKTPTNIAKEAIKTSPVGFLNVARKAALGTYKNAPNKMTEELAKATLGSLIAVPVVLGALREDITGAAPTGKNERDAFYRNGKQPYSIKVGDRWVSYHRLEPIGTVIGVIADFTSITKEEGLDNAAKSIATIIGRNLNDKTFLSGISNFIDALTDDEKRENFVANFASGLVPFSGTQRFITRLADPTIRKPEGITETIKAQTPGLSKSVPERLDAFGQAPKRTLSQNLSPIGMTEEKTDSVESELKRLKIAIGFPSKAIAGQELTREEYQRYAQVSGKTLKDVLEGIINNPSWNTLSDREKEVAINRATTKVRDKVGSSLFPMKSKANEIKKRLIERGLTSQQAEELTAKIIEDLGRNQGYSKPAE